MIGSTGTLINLSAADAIAELLNRSNVSHVFGVPGETALGVLAAIERHPHLEFVVTRHEEGAGIMAHASARLLRRPGVVLVSRAPGLAHTMVAVHNAMQDSIPLLVLVGQVATHLAGSEAFQEVDVVSAARPWSKWAVEALDGVSAVDAVSRGLALAQCGRPGPVVISLPNGVEDQPVDWLPPSTTMTRELGADPDEVEACLLYTSD